MLFFTAQLEKKLKNDIKNYITIKRHRKIKRKREKNIINHF